MVQKSINAICRKRGIKFYAAEVFGFYGYFFCDLLEHSFTQENREVAYGSEIVTKDTITQTYVTLEEAFSGTYDKVAGKNDKKFGQLRFMASPLLFAIQSNLGRRMVAG